MLAVPKPPIDICGLSATELARRIAAGELSALEAVEAHIQRIEQVNARLNAVVVKRYDAARAEARAIDGARERGEPLGPLAGVPVTIKECLDLEGTPSTFGIAGRAGHRAASDDPFVARLRAAGAIVLGKTNVAQILLFTEADNPLHGRTNNPWDAERSCGGSSGGEGAIIASGGAALGLGTDLGGSLRVPAAFCGIAALRPTAGRCPDQGRFSMPIGQRAIVSQVGPLARHVDDLALALTLINGAAPLPDFRAVDVSKLRVAAFTDDGNFSPAPAAQRAVHEAAEALRAAGAQVAAWQPPAIDTAIALFFRLLTADGGSGMRRVLRGEKRDKRIAQLLLLAGAPRWLLRPLAGLLGALGQKRLAAGLRLFGNRSADDYWQAVETQMDYQRGFAQSLDLAPGGPFDLILCPAHAVPAVRHGATLNMPLPGAYTLLANVLGYPAGVVPFTRVHAGEETARAKSRDVVESTARASEQGSAGLPIGVQVIARPWQDHVALAAMQAIETAARRRADYPVLQNV